MSASVRRVITTRPTTGDAAAGALLLLGLASAVLLFALLPTPAARLAVAGGALVAVLGLWQINRALVGIVDIVIALIVAALIFTQQPDASRIGIVVAVVLVIIMGVAGLFASEVIRTVYRRVTEYRHISDALTPIDATTGALKQAFGRDRLRSEVARAFRYQRSFSLLIGKPADWRGELDRRGGEGAEVALAEAVRLVASRLRNTDIISLESDRAIAIILTETTAEGGEYAAQHLQSALRSDNQMEMRFGLVQFPDDGVTEEKLISEAYDALTFAEMANMPMASRRELLAGSGTI